jgi:hypothetical protein
MHTIARCLGWMMFGMALLSIQACGVSTSVASARQAVTQFHQQLDAADFDSIWNGADDGFRHALSRDGYDKFIGAVHTKLGPVVKTTPMGWSVNYINYRTRVVLQQQTDFAHGSGLETFVFFVNGNDVRLDGYTINSTDLITL